jgi:hypothetical protein
MRDSKTAQVRLRGGIGSSCSFQPTGHQLVVRITGIWASPDCGDPSSPYLIGWNRIKLTAKILEEFAPTEVLFLGMTHKRIVGP